MPNDNNIQPLAIDANYPQWLQQLKERYRQAQIKAASRVNEELLRYYWQLGADIDARGDENRYGTGFFEMLSRDLQQLMPEAEGFSESNLKFAVRFYRMYAVSAENRQQTVNESQIIESQADTNREQVVPDFTGSNCEQLVHESCKAIDDAIFRTPWGHHILILKKVKGDLHKALFYVHMVRQAHQPIPESIEGRQAQQPKAA